MEKNGLVIFNKKGRLKLLSLTNKGKDLAEAFEKVRNLLDKK
jgi:predicted transcriptional regulator